MMNKDSLEPGEREFAQTLHEALRRGERESDFATSARLRAARARAVDAARPRPPWTWALSGACAATLVALLVLPRHWLASPPMETAQLEMLEMLGGDEAPVLYQDLDVLQSLDDGADPV